MTIRSSLPLTVSLLVTEPRFEFFFSQDSRVQNFTCWISDLLQLFIFIFVQSWMLMKAFSYFWSWIHQFPLISWIVSFMWMAGYFRTMWILSKKWKLFKTIFIYIILKDIVWEKKHTQNLTNISINKGAVSILVRALKNRQFSPGTQGVKSTVQQESVCPTLTCA